MGRAADRRVWKLCPGGALAADPVYVVIKFGECNDRNGCRFGIGHYDRRICGWSRVWARAWVHHLRGAIEGFHDIENHDSDPTLFTPPNQGTSDRRHFFIPDKDTCGSG